MLPVLVVVLLTLAALTGCGTVGNGLRATSVARADGPWSMSVPAAAPAAVARTEVRPRLETTRSTGSVDVLTRLSGDESAPAVSATGAVDEAPRVVAPPTGDGEPPVDAALVAEAAPAAVDAPSAVAEGGPGPADESAASALTAPAAAGAAPMIVAQSRRSAEDDEYDVEVYDPWEPFNERMFEFNRKLDRYVLKPVAKAYDRVVHDEIQRMIGNAFDNLGAIKRMVNSLLQAKWDGAGRELGRFVLNSTVGIGGLFDVGRSAEIEKSREDFGQTLGVYGARPGPYLVLPLMEPMTVRDGIGRGVDSLFDPLGWFVPIGIIERIAVKVTDTVNERSLNLELFQGFEETVIDMYSAVRHAYLERRRNLIKQ
ncbi:MAG: VacJ family lipoprotein [Candidatus Rokubacteria bacterium]|nr:VacJ family lipoprotein [Candidatus Rokubacteria bacterium]